MIREDYRSEPARRLVVMGESNAYGMSASSPKNEWVQVLADCIREFQHESLRVFNNSIPANVISPNAPGYAPAVSGNSGSGEMILCYDTTAKSANLLQTLTRYLLMSMDCWKVLHGFLPPTHATLTMWDSA